MDHFLPFYPPNKSKNQNFEKMKKTPEDIIILHRCNISDNHMMYSSWDMERDGHNFLSFWTVVCSLPPPPPPFPLPPSNNQKSQNFWKINKGPGDITILHMSTINGNRMIYGSRDIKHDRQMSQMWQMSFWIIFCPFTPLTTQKMKILKKWKKTLGDTSFLHKCIKNHDHMPCCSLDIARNGCNCYFSFWAIFCPFTSLTAGKI